MTVQLSPRIAQRRLSETLAFIEASERGLDLIMTAVSSTADHFIMAGKNKNL
jgi:hypothetical protein